MYKITVVGCVFFGSEVCLKFSMIYFAFLSLLSQKNLLRHFSV